MESSLPGGRIDPVRAVVEVILIAVGVLAGMSAEAWLAAQSERNLEVEYLEALDSEMQNNLALLSRVIGDAEDREREGIAMIQAHLDDQNAASVPTRDLLRLFGFNPFLGITATADQLVASGDFSVVRSPSVRTAVASWSATVQATSDYVNQEQWANWVSPSLPFLREHVGSVEMFAVWNEQGFDGLDVSDGVILSEEAANVIAERLLVIGDVISNARLLQRRAEQVSEAVAAAR